MESRDARSESRPQLPQEARLGRHTHLDGAGDRVRGAQAQVALAARRQLRRRGSVDRPLHLLSAMRRRILRVYGMHAERLLVRTRRSVGLHRLRRTLRWELERPTARWTLSSFGRRWNRRTSFRGLQRRGGRSTIGPEQKERETRWNHELRDRSPAAASSRSSAWEARSSGRCRQSRSRLTIPGRRRGA